MRSFFDPSPSLLKPTDIVTTFTKSSTKDLLLPPRAVVVVDAGNLSLLAKKTSAVRIAAWSPYRTIYQVPGRETVLVRSAFGGPNMAVLAEELSCFGVREICFWGYCGGIDEHLPVGEKILVTRALREEGTSYHYLSAEEDCVSSDWLPDWQEVCGRGGFIEGIIWSCDAPYRETSEKAVKYSRLGILGVEMEVASLYAVCSCRGLHGIAFLVVSDLIRESGWTPGFSSPKFKEGVQAMATFILENVV